MSKSLYICYFGLREPLVQTQVLPYLRELLKDGHEISLLTFEPEFRAQWTAEDIEFERKKLEDEGITWHCLGYHKRFSVLATAYDTFAGTSKVSKLLRQENYDLLHCRIHIPMLMAALARKLTRRKPKLIFDIRGFFPEEYTDAGVWPENGWLYRSVKRVEKWLMKEADGFVVLTKKAREILFPEITTDIQDGGYDKLGRPVEVIPCCVDLGHFENVDPEFINKFRTENGLNNRKVFTYVGSFGGWYLTNEMMDFFECAKKFDPSTFVLILTQREPESIRGLLRGRGFADEDFFVNSTEPANIPAYLYSADVATSFIKPGYSKKSSSPTKIAEYLAAGLPIIANSGIGDTDEMLLSNDVGVIINEFSPEAYKNALESISNRKDPGKNCREEAIKNFDLGLIGGPRYRRLYFKVLQ